MKAIKNRRNNNVMNLHRNYPTMLFYRLCPYPIAKVKNDYQIMTTRSQRHYLLKRKLTMLKKAKLMKTVKL